MVVLGRDDRRIALELVTPSIAYVHIDRVAMAIELP